MISVTIDKADEFVSKMQGCGVDVRWDGWNMIFFREDQRGRTHKNGRRQGSKWGFETVVSPDSTTGKWMIPYGATRVVG